MSIVGRDIQLTKDYTPGNAIFKQGRRGTVIEALSRKDRKWKVKFNNDIKKYRLIKGCDLQHEGVWWSRALVARILDVFYGFYLKY